MAQRRRATPCSIDGCDRMASSRGWCGLHYQRWLRFGDASHPVDVRYSRKPRSEDRWVASIWQRIDKNGPNGCWLWTAGTNHYGYAWVRRADASVYIHRLTYEWAHGAIPDGKQIDHLCRVRNCVNPAHLEAVDQRTNILRGVGIAAQNAAKTHCSKGHEYTDDNIYWGKPRTPNARPRRDCKTCRKASAAVYQRQRTEQRRAA